MKKVFTAADRYIETSNWKTIAVLKFCLLALGYHHRDAGQKRAQEACPGRCRDCFHSYLYPAYGKILPYPERSINVNLYRHKRALKKPESFDSSKFSGFLTRCQPDLNW